MIQPDLELTHSERAHLYQITSMEGYGILDALMRSEVDKFIVALINADAAEESDVIARHKIAKAAAQFYQAVTHRVKEEALQYTGAMRATDKPLDATEGIIDLGPISEYLPNLLGGGEDFE